MKKILILLFSIVYIFAAQIGILSYKNGMVKVKHKNTIIKKTLKIGDTIYKGDKISTYNSLATITLNDKSIIKLAKYSTIRFGNKITQENGKVYYHITHRKNNILEVATAFTTIGVKGTIFIVDANKTKQVALKKGLISLTAPKGKYEIHSYKNIKDEFADFKNNYSNEFDSYKKKMEKEFIEYKKSFELHQNMEVTFNGNKAYKKKLDKNEFKYFEENFK